jgi:hypothetical protein
MLCMLVPATGMLRCMFSWSAQELVGEGEDGAELVDVEEVMVGKEKACSWVLAKNWLVEERTEGKMGRSPWR